MELDQKLTFQTKEYQYVASLLNAYFSDTVLFFKPRIKHAALRVTRAVPLKRMWARIVQEAGARMHTYLRNLNLLEVGPRDDRRAEVTASGLQVYMVHK